MSGAASALSARGYRLLGVLGEGGMARVYLAVSRRTAGFAKLVVLKVLRTSTGEPDLERMFLAEARIAALLNHPNVVQTHEAADAEGHPFLAMEYLEGKPLSALRTPAREGLVTPDVELRIIADALRGLHYAHEVADVDGTPLDIVHRDVSPQNVFVTFDGASKIVDFGIAKLSGAPNTETGIVKGKVGYVAPEQVRGDPSDRRADVFAAGVMIWEALAGRRLVRREDDDTAALMRRMKGEDPPIQKIAPNAPPGIAKICDKAMSANAADRHPTALALSEEIEGWLAANDGADAKKVAAVLESLFGEERKKTKALIAEQLKTESGPLLRLDDDHHRLVTMSAPVSSGTGDAVTDKADPPTDPKRTTTSGAHIADIASASKTPTPAGKSRRRMIVGLVAVIAALAGITAFKILPRRAAGAQPPPSVECIGKVSWPPEDPTTIVKSRYRFVNFAKRPVAGVVVEVCAQLDPHCAKPLFRSAPSDATGHTMVDVPRAFRGTTQVSTSPPSIEDLVKTILYVFPMQLVDDPPNKEIPLTQSAVLFSRTELNGLLLLGGVGTLEDGKGHIMAAAQDCADHPFPGVHVEPNRIDPKTIRFYGNANDMPVVTTTGGETAGSAQFGFINLSPGPIVVEATVPKMGLHLGKLDVIIRADYVTSFLFVPTP